MNPSMGFSVPWNPILDKKSNVTILLMTSHGSLVAAATKLDHRDTIKSENINNIDIFLLFNLLHLLLHRMDFTLLNLSFLDQIFILITNRNLYK